jgi:hypothetical protein
MELASPCVRPIPPSDENALTSSMTTGILAIVVMIFTFMFPESPRWLALKGRMEEARQVIAVIDDVEPDSPHVDFIIASITSMNEIAGEKASFFSLFKYGKEKIVYRLLIASATQLFSQMSGSALITYYAETLFTAVGLSHDLSKILGATDLTFKFICCAIPFFLIERAGRRKLLIIAASGMSTCMVSHQYQAHKKKTQTLTSSSAWPSVDLRSPRTISSQHTSLSFSPLFSLPSTQSVSSVSTSSTLKKSLPPDTEHLHPVSPLPFTGFLPSLLLVSCNPFIASCISS